MTDLRKLRWWLIIAILACAGLYLVGNGRVPLWDRDEGWYAQCSKEMWETGDWVVPKFLGGLRTEKPVFVYWLQLGGYALFGGPSEFAVRFYAAVAQTLVLIILGTALWKMVGPLRGVWTAVIYGTCVMAIVSAKMCLTDATLMVCLTSTQLILMYFYLHGFRWWGVVLMGIALGVGGLTKGPVALIPTILTMLALGVIEGSTLVIKAIKRKFVTPAPAGVAVPPDDAPVSLNYERQQEPVWPSAAQVLSTLGRWTLAALVALLIIAAVCAPWLIELHRRAPDWIPMTLNMASRHVRTSLEGHSGPFGYYLALVWGTFFPWSLLIPATVYVAWKQRHVPQTRFAVAATLGPWIFFEIMRTKLPHYVLPTFPFLSLLVADALVRCSRSQYRELHRTRSVVAVGIWAVLIGLVGSAPWVAAIPGLNTISWLAFVPSVKIDELPVAAMAVASILGFAFTLGVWWFFYQRRTYMACAWMAGGFIVFIAVTYGWLIPESKYLQYSPQLAQILAQYDGLADKAPVDGVVSLVYPRDDETYGFREPTLHYYQGGTLRVIEQDGYLEKTPPEKWPRLMVITRSLWDVLPRPTQDQLETLGTVHGYLYSDVHRMADVMVMRRKPAPATQPIETGERQQ